jgi:tetratricopeptide (TPR) repeat protein
LTLTLGLAATIGSARRAHAQGTAPAAPPPQTAPMSEEARVHYDRGLAFYGAKDYRAAFAELEAGYAVDPRREFLFAEAQAQRLAGDCQRAVPLYQRFLATDPSPVQVNAAQVGLARCAQQMAAAPPAPPPPPLPTVPALPPPTPWYRDSVGGALLAGGVIGLGVGAGFLIAAAVAHNDATIYDDYAQRQSTIERRGNIGVGALAAGAVLTAAATYRYHHVRAVRLSPTISGAVRPSFRWLLLEGRF